MNGKTAVQRHRKLTEKGQATRARILEQAAELIHTKGVAATNNEQLRRVTGISGSQLSHYFPTKGSLVMAVIEWQTEQVMRFYGSEQFAGFDTIEALRSWVDYYVTHESAYRDGCTLGSLASQIIKSDLQVHDELARAFDQWRNIFRDGLRRMQSLGRLSATADPTQLADLLLSAFQGGMLLTQVQRDVTPLKNALHAAIDHVQTFAE
ncbi:Putative transcriptional regulator, TetR family [Mycobacteroides abscessus subsp. abscessus]|uniref:TetR/AcrR family transcriptional regulator n=1 Tax=Mycobacteroides abscessus TaxID=36809 RepID=UPI000927EDF1|nr:TetR/AcrR family transcriptional regulator [Mycobacteroides abscessus]MDO3084941.1 TetR/AcrR family transcriptional regulator [Mycobacteroides abscessus subsp. abscessus]SHR31059.1 Putative transcriptional regulator, TetR family [Mycobacteroides abscessus subsp. abscessus]SHZ88065.1 Putative transcriptional regulator, TetR family [Mycobacteroides abscessus subsp. abscessus]SIC37004.1 Putative transcriptional regulator, TetR family [Mycobacteroides abscessus subsp. abscessus]SIE81654.1 Putat